MSTTSPLPNRRAPREPASDTRATRRLCRHLRLGAVVGVKAGAMNLGEQRCPECHGVMRLVMQERTYNDRARRRRHECYDCQHRSTSYLLNDDFFQQLTAAHDIVQRLQGFYFDHCDAVN